MRGGRITRGKLLLASGKARAATDEAAAPHPVRPSPADVRAMRAAVAAVPPSRQELLALLAALRKPAESGRFREAAFTGIARVRERIRTAEARVRQVGHSNARQELLVYLAALDGIFTVLADVGRSTDPYRAARLHAQAVALEARARSAYQTVAPWLGAGARAATP
jgi:hypothetical protein